MDVGLRRDLVGKFKKNCTWLALHSFQNKFACSNVEVVSDNKVFLMYFDHFCPSVSLHSCHITYSLWVWCAFIPPSLSTRECKNKTLEKSTQLVLFSTILILPHKKLGFMISLAVYLFPQETLWALSVRQEFISDFTIHYLNGFIFCMKMNAEILVPVLSLR